jgi:predicted GTPase
VERLKPIRVLILGAAGRDFHNFNTVFRDDPGIQVVAFTATQIPNIHGRMYPASLAGPLYPKGIPILPEEDLEAIIHRQGVERVVFSYSDVSHAAVMHLASRALASGADFMLLGMAKTALPSRVPVIAVCAVRTGSGKSQTTRRVLNIVRSRKLRAVVVRHPMPYGDLARQRVQRFAALRDLKRAGCTVEEREEYEPHLALGAVVYAGVDYGDILRRAETEADVILWDGGNNDLPFYRPNVHIVVADPLRAGHELNYHPGEANLRAADVVVINKVDSASVEQVIAVRESVRAVNPRAVVIEAASPVFADRAGLLRGKRVLVVEDGPTLTHGEMATGAGYVAALRAGVREIADPHEFAVGRIREYYRRYPRTGPVLPAMGYLKDDLPDMARTIAASGADAVVVATPIDLASLIKIAPPVVRVRYELQEIGRPDLADVLEPLLKSRRRGKRAGGKRGAARRGSRKGGRKA